MNKKDIVTRVNIDKVAKFLQKSIPWLIEQDSGCCHFNLSEDLALYIGWSNGFDMADEDLIKSASGRELVNNPTKPWTCGWAIEAAVKIRNDGDCSDFEYLDYPWYEDGECWDNGSTMRPNMTKRDYNREAKWFLETFVAMTNAHKKGEIKYA